MRHFMKLVHIVMSALVMLLVHGATAEGEVKTFHLEEVTISEVHAAYKSGAITATRLVQAYLERIQAYDRAGPKLNVVIFLPLAPSPAPLRTPRGCSTCSLAMILAILPRHGASVISSRTTRH